MIFIFAPKWFLRSIEYSYHNYTAINFMNNKVNGVAESINRLHSYIIMSY